MRVSTRKRKYSRVGLACVSAGVLTAVGLSWACGAKADPADPVDDLSSWSATCTVLGQDLTGDVFQDTIVTVGIAKAIAKYDNSTVQDATQVENAQVLKYCPKFWPYLVAVGDYARNSDTATTTPTWVPVAPTKKKAA